MPCPYGRRPQYLGLEEARREVFARTLTVAGPKERFREVVCYPYVQCELKDCG